jgi:hypothetical protein
VANEEAANQTVPDTADQSDPSSLVGRFVPRTCMDIEDDFGMPFLGRGIIWHLPEGRDPEDLYLAVLQHIICARTNEMALHYLERLREDKELGVDIPEDADPLTVWWESHAGDRAKTGLGPIVDLRALKRIVSGQYPATSKFLAYMMNEVEDELKPNSEKIYAQFHNARAALIQEDGRRTK